MLTVITKVSLVVSSVCTVYGFQTIYIFTDELLFSQIADFGMARDLIDENYYMSHGGRIPVKWTAPEVCDHTDSTTVKPL